MILAQLTAALALVVSQAEPAPPFLSKSSTPKSLLVVVLDDVGAEHLDWTPQGQDAGLPVSTPTLSALAAEGVRYSKFWTTPVCSSTRSALLTGRYGHRTGVGTAIPGSSSYSLALTETTIADRMLARGYRTAYFGKWHLGNVNSEQTCSMGFSAWSGSQDGMAPGGYWSWERWDDTSSGTATFTQESAYAPSATTEAARAWIGAQQGPWFAIVAYSLAHAPYHDPPGTGPFKNNLYRYRAMIERLDGEIAVLLGAVDLTTTTVLVFSDNGSPQNMALYPNTTEHSKSTAYRGGVETTLLCAGYAVNRAICEGKNVAGQVIGDGAHVVDIYGTALQLLRGPDPGGWPATDSETLYTPAGGWMAPSRDYLFTEVAEPLGVAPGGPYTKLSRAVEQIGYKAVWDLDGVELYEVWSDPYETLDLLLDGVSAQEQAILDGMGDVLEGVGL